MTNTSRRIRTVPALFVFAVLMVVALPLWVPIAIVIDLVRGRWRLPLVRLLAFGLCWSWIESVGILAAGLFLLLGQRRNIRLHTRLQTWWAGMLMKSLGATTGMRVSHADFELFHPGPTVLLCRHASLADSLVSAWVTTSLAHLEPRYVLKKELEWDPCLDIVGHRLNNHFLDREATDAADELTSLRNLSAGMGEHNVAVIFPEGTRSSAKKRARALEKIAERDPERADRLRGLQHLIPPRPAGSQALIDGCPQADIVVAWHVGFDGLNDFGGILRHLQRTPTPIQFHARRFRRADVPSGEAFTEWLDQQWIEADHHVAALLTPEGA
jgi:1-acyl-sn-glycerol-3-phosphate acyltransferase